MTDVILDRYRQRADRFEALVAATPADRWGYQSPCDEWDARDVVSHITDMYHHVLGCAGSEPRPAPSVADDPLGAFRVARTDVEGLLTDSEMAARVVDTPTGPQRVADHVDGVPSADLVLHGWDLARTTGQDDAIDPEELAQLWPELEQLPDEMRIPDHFGPGVVVFGPEVAVPEDAPIQDRVLGAAGRDPRFVPHPRT